MSRDLLFWWEVTQLVGETVFMGDIQDFLDEHNMEHEINFFKTSCDEVLQLYTDEECITVVGGSSGDKDEWKSNKDVGELVNGVIHEGFYDLAEEVLFHKSLIRRPSMIWDGHSRGSACVSIICYLTKEVGFGFGTPKAFKDHVEIGSFTNVINFFDPVCYVVPAFKPVGNLIKVSFLRRPHTRYDRKLLKLRRKHD